MKFYLALCLVARCIVDKWLSIAFEGYYVWTLGGIRVSNGTLFVNSRLLFFIYFFSLYVELNPCHNIFHGSNNLFGERFIEVTGFQANLKHYHEHFMIRIDHHYGFLIEPCEIISHRLKVLLTDIEQVVGRDLLMFARQDLVDQLFQVLLIVSH